MAQFEMKDKRMHLDLLPRTIVRLSAEMISLFVKKRRIPSHALPHICAHFYAMREDIENLGRRS